MGIFKHLQNEVQEREKREGITLADLLELDPPLRRLMNRVTRYGEMTVSQAAELLEDTPESRAVRGTAEAGNKVLKAET